MNSSKGITLASLVVIIASIILLSSLAIHSGYKYIKETKSADENYFKEILSNAVLKRENNYKVSSGEYNRIGYHVNTQADFENIIDNCIPELVSANKTLMFEEGEWYIVDAQTAKELGVKDVEKYMDIIDLNIDKKQKVSMVNYIDGSTYIFEMNNSKLNYSGDRTLDKNKVGCKHENVSGLTCNNDKRCLDCGYILEVATGHAYESVAIEEHDDKFHYTKKCTKCGMTSGFEKHSGDSSCDKCGYEL